MGYPDSIDEVVITIINEVTLIPVEELESSFDKSVYDLGIDSMLFVGIIGRLEEHFGISIPNKIIDPRGTFESIIRNIKSIVSKKKKATSTHSKI